MSLPCIHFLRKVLTRILLVALLPMGASALKAELTLVVIGGDPNPSFYFEGSTSTVTPVGGVVHWQSGGSSSFANGGTGYTNPFSFSGGSGFNGFLLGNSDGNIALHLNFAGSSSVTITGQGSGVTNVYNGSNSTTLAALNSLIGSSIRVGLVSGTPVSTANELVAVPELGTSLFVFAPIAMLFGVRWLRRKK